MISLSKKRIYSMPAGHYLFYLSQSVGVQNTENIPQKIDLLEKAELTNDFNKLSKG